MPLDLEATIDGCRVAHRSLRVTLGKLDDETARAPSRLPGWSVGHLLTHLARNADSHVRMLEGALAGEHLEQYPGGRPERDADIEAGAARPAFALVDDLVVAFARLEDTWDRMTPEAWDGHGVSAGQMRPCRNLPFMRWREVEVHHVDLGMGYEVENWPQAYLGIELPLALARLPHRIEDHAGRAHLLAWLLGRADE
ncbi:MAG TPA: maleylpyruvate isomerase N-terminal domain-containing protein, partial [Acidimicrobiales bacterium]|nr:maleylpyruvate isomerase N-terminal domain-containing protein [Acidimicrobiales bacterium]